jgi:ATP-dependent RNA helicase RhlE
MSVTFAELGLVEPLMRALNSAGYTIPTPIQAGSIPLLMKGGDLLGLAETGTGKTAAFVLPLLQRLAADPTVAQFKGCRALILAPTRELAVQIGESIAVYGKFLNIRHTVIFGGVGSRPQINAVQRGIDIVVATPGRLLDLVSSRHLSLGGVSFLILDEADRMLDMGFIKDVRKIVKMVPAKRQTLLFSATMPHDIAALAAEILYNPQRVEVARAGKTVDRIDQRVHFVETKQKRTALIALLKDPALSRVIVFTRTKRGADKVTQGLHDAGISAYAIHGNKSQGARQQALDTFKAGRTRVLVATDIAARGIDIDDITHVINYELPNIPESYVHRIGRTARAGSEGIAIALCAGDERAYLRDIERLTKKPLTVGGSIAGIADVPAEVPYEPRNEVRPTQGRGQQGQRQGQGQGRGGQGRGGQSQGQRPEQGFNADRKPRSASPRNGAAVGRDDRRPRDDRAPRQGGERSSNASAPNPASPWNNWSGKPSGERRPAPASQGYNSDRPQQGERRDSAAAPRGDRQAPQAPRDGGNRRPGEQPRARTGQHRSA